VIFALIAFGLAAWQFPAVNPRQTTLTYALAAVVTTAVFLASLLAHEVAHSLVARHYGLMVKSITPWLFGGSPTWAARRPARRPRRGSPAWAHSRACCSAWSSSGWPSCSAHPTRRAPAFPGSSKPPWPTWGSPTWARFVFNVIPAAPLDGGRLLRAIIWWRTGDRVKATVWASWSGQLFGTICIAGGLYTFFLTRDWS
jgi:Zn-dependent protease